LKARSCRNCIYLIYPAGGTCTVPVCINKDGSPGRLHYTEREGCCCNFQPKREISRRQKPRRPESDDVRFIPLTQGKFAIVDADDYDRLATHKWYAYKSGFTYYAGRRDAHRPIIMHRQIMNAPKGLLVDHINNNGLNNRKNNLRLCTKAQNTLNRRPVCNSASKYKGVCRYRRLNKWQAQIMYHGKRTYLGRFVDEETAAIAYDRMAEKLFGEFAYLNFPQLADFRKWLRKIVFGE